MNLTFETLKKARDLISDKDCWGTHNYCTTRSGEVISIVVCPSPIGDEKNYLWCALGALVYQFPAESRISLIGYLSSYMSTMSHKLYGIGIGALNDSIDPKHGYAAVLKVYDRLIAEAE